MEQQLSISESEWRVMKIVWSNSPQTLPEILDRLKETGWSKTTIQTYLARLVKKGALTTKRQGKGYLYYPAVSESECQLAESRSFLSRVYDGSLSKMVMGFVKNGNLSSDELHELKSLIEQQEKNRCRYSVTFSMRLFLCLPLAVYFVFYLFLSITSCVVRCRYGFRFAV